MLAFKMTSDNIKQSAVKQMMNYKVANRVKWLVTSHNKAAIASSQHNTQ